MLHVQIRLLSFMLAITWTLRVFKKILVNERHYFSFSLGHDANIVAQGILSDFF